MKQLAIVRFNYICFKFFLKSQRKAKLTNREKLYELVMELLPRLGEATTVVVVAPGKLMLTIVVPMGS